MKNYRLKELVSALLRSKTLASAATLDDQEESNTRGEMGH
jgi:hypothetical protein